MNFTTSDRAPVRLIINGREVYGSAGETVLTIAERAGFSIPALCRLKRFPPNTSCMVCMVEEQTSGRLIPSCSAPAEEGMIIETDTLRVREFRRSALELLLSEHVGDCTAPCTRSCPAQMNIPLMIRQIQNRNWRAAIETVKAQIALPAVLGRICPAPCENACTRKIKDGAIAICLLKRIVADLDLASGSSYKPDCPPESGKRAAIVGAGPAGLAAAYYLRRFGHGVHLFEKEEALGGNLRKAVSPEALPRKVLDAEIEQILSLGISTHFGIGLGRDIQLSQLHSQFDAVVLTTGVGADLYQGELAVSGKGVQADRRTLQTSLLGVFAGGNLIAESRMAVRAVAHGKTIAHSVDQYLRRHVVTGRPTRFSSIIGRLRPDEVENMAKSASPTACIQPSNPASGFTEEEAVAEALRCLHCDCRKPNSCLLRLYAEEYGADQKQFRLGERFGVELEDRHELVVYEPSKCIKCGICIQIAEAAKERIGLAFIGRGFAVRLAVPFNEALERGLENTALQCAEACPTAAISLKNHEEAEP